MVRAREESNSTLLGTLHVKRTKVVFRDGTYKFKKKIMSDVNRMMRLKQKT